MRRIYCPECKDNKEIIGYMRDDPLLECGHVKPYNDSLETLLDESIYIIMEKENMTYDEACKWLSAKSESNGRGE